MQEGSSPHAAAVFSSCLAEEALGATGRLCGSRGSTQSRGLVTYRTRQLLGFLFLNRALILFYFLIFFFVRASALFSL